MADQESVAADIVKVATAGFELTQQLYKIARRIGVSGSDVRSYAKETNAFSTTLLSIKTQLLLSQTVSTVQLDLVKEITDLCSEILTPLTRVQRTLNRSIKLHGTEPKNIQKISQRIQWYFSERQKLLFFREALRSQQQNLDTLLAAMSYDDSREGIDEMIFENKMREESHTVNELAPKVSFLHDSPPSFLAPTTFEPHEDGYDSDDSYNSPRMSADLEKCYEAGLPFLTERELQELDDKIENDLDPNGEGTGLMLWKDSRVLSRRTKQFAESVLKSNAVCTTPHTSTKPFSSSLQDMEMQSGPWIQDVRCNELRSSSPKRKSPFPNRTMLGISEKEEFRVWKDEKENVVQVVEKPLKWSEARKRRSIFSTMIWIMSQKDETRDVVQVVQKPLKSPEARKRQNIFVPKKQIIAQKDEAVSPIAWKKKRLSAFGQLRQTLRGPTTK